ncbi:hypothetical protein [Bacillus inaquosorum]|uniref:hypothetical protein n=1 Tax=Bacillus inaquosorum TaxID=483913 RepID=UPI0022831423|nr:hypothetical protein [Bacillus inaquosorum]MCY7907952.1 hypothetical protein [Bacillus inaquosorum]MCY8860695.1 hypothetical protein [Bacillus inaquosorum]MCY8875502.1 hypothetical protein [Bacillus inaquosorum]
MSENDVTLDVSLGYNLYRDCITTKNAYLNLVIRAEELIKVDTGVDIDLSADEVANMTVLEFMTKLADAKGGAE